MTRSEMRFRALVDAGLHTGDCDNCSEPLGDEVLEGLNGWYCSSDCRSEAEDDEDWCDDDDAYVDLDLVPV